MRQPQPPVETLALRPREAARSLGISPRKLWDLTQRGEIPHLRLGRRVLYPVALLHEWLAEEASSGRKRGDQ